MEYEPKGASAASDQRELRRGESPGGGASARGQAQELLQAEIREGFVEEGLLLKDASQDLDVASIENWIISQVMQTLAGTQAPLPDVVFGDREDGRAPMAAFDHHRWVIEMGRVDFSKQDQITQLLSTAYHEAVHVEQWFLGLRAYAGMHPGMTAADIAEKERIEIAVVQLAFESPLTGHAVAEKWFDALFGEASIHRRQVLEEKQLAKTRLRTFDAQLAELELQGDSPEVRRARAGLRVERDLVLKTLNERFGEYLKLPEEAEAHEQGKKTADALGAQGPG